MRWLLLVCLTGFFVAIGCAGADAVPLTVEEYIAATCGDKSASDDDTWGELRDETRDRIDRFEKVTPPAALKEYHQAKVAGMKAAEKFAKSKESGETANMFEAFGDPALMATVLAMVAVEEDLQSGFRQLLERGNC